MADFSALIAIVSSNEAGKSSLLRALMFLENGEAFSGLLQAAGAPPIPKAAIPARRRHHAVDQWCRKQRGGWRAPSKRRIAGRGLTLRAEGKPVGTQRAIYLIGARASLRDAVRSIVAASASVDADDVLHDLANLVTLVSWQLDEPGHQAINAACRRLRASKPPGSAVW
jgi:hypothetical protein